MAVIGKLRVEGAYQRLTYYGVAGKGIAKQASQAFASTSVQTNY